MGEGGNATVIGHQSFCSRVDRMEDNKLCNAGASFIYVSMVDFRLQMPFVPAPVNRAAVDSFSMILAEPPAIAGGGDILDWQCGL